MYRWPAKALISDLLSSRSAQNGASLAAFKRGLALLAYMDATGSATAATLHRTTAIGRPTLARLLGTLASLELVRDQGGAFELLPSVRRLGLAYLDSCGAGIASEVFLQKIADRLGEPVALKVIDGSQVTAVARRNPSDRMRPYRMKLGVWTSASETAAGRLLARAFPTSAHDGGDCEVLDGEFERDLIGVAAPVQGFGPNDRFALHISVGKDSGTLDRAEREIGPALSQEAARLSFDLRDWKAAQPEITAPAVLLPEVGPPDHVTALARGLNAMCSLDAWHDLATILSVSDRTGVDRAVARRIVHTLHEVGFAQCTEGGYRLTPRALRLGFSHYADPALSALVQPKLDVLSTRLNEAVSIYMLKDGFPERLARSDLSGRRMAYMIRQGSRLPLALSASGRVLLAQLGEDDARALLDAEEFKPQTTYSAKSRAEILQLLALVRCDGYAISAQELDEGMISAAVPLNDRLGQPRGALAISSQVDRMSTENIRHDVLPLLRRAAREIGACI